jgi:valyl-tRNA synthetase
MQEIPSKYEPKEVESRWYAFWEKNDLFRADPKSEKPPYVIVLPPPNVTGVLHIGHALTCTLEDILIRHKRMQGFEALWVPGTDHAGIATQMVVERNLKKETGKSRHDLGREKFLEKVWEWKKQSETTILSQLRLMGCSLDWTKLRFTMDEGVSRAVRETFVRLFEEGLIYRNIALIQWCPQCRTALSDLEVKAKDVQGKLWKIRYPLKSDPKRFLTVATTRPETLLGDTAVAVHPDDARYKDFQGKTVLVPLLKREVPVIADAYVDKEFGTGCLKITPGHDANDAEVAKRHGLPTISIFDEGAKVNEQGGPYQGLSREKAREKVLGDLTAEGLLEGETNHAQTIPTCDRCATILEPRISPQWYVNAEVLAKPALEAVKKGEIQIVPKEWEKTYFNWMENIRPWCISRQLWWGHRLPVWQCGDCREYTASVETPKACRKCKGTSLKQEEDVLDTWFSSGLWPFSTLGWPDDTPDMRRFYPNSVMETGFDILFFWVARMIMLGMKMCGKVPFHTVYLHPMVRDEYGQKMSKTKGNVKDPLEIIGTVGADALRFTLASMSVHGRDVLLSDSRIQGYRNFVNKIWNAARFVQMHFGAVTESKSDRSDEVNQWIWTALKKTTQEVSQALDGYRFYEAAEKLYHFIWSEYCDWYLELIKTDIEARKAKKDSTAVEVLEAALRLLHPIMPFATEEIWQKLPLRAKVKSISIAPYPKPEELEGYPEASAKIDRLVAIVEAIRTRRGENNVAPSVQLEVGLTGPDTLRGHLDLIGRLAGAKVALNAPPASDVVLIALKDTEVRIQRAGLIDLAAEKEKAKRELDETIAALSRANQKLKNSDFCDKAPPQVIQGVREQKAVLEKKRETLEGYLKELG